jgi:2-iminobutanoate/2-iminopropanoate deaminase
VSPFRDRVRLPSERHQVILPLVAEATKRFRANLHNGLHMPTWNAVTLPDAPPPKGPYSPAVRAGPFVFVSGQVPRNPVTGELVGTDVATQTRQTLSNVQRLLEESGASLRDVVSVIIYLANVDDWGTMNSVYTDFFKSPYPSRTAIGAELRDILVEISAVAYVGGNS